MTNDTWATGDILTGNTGSAGYAATGTGEAWFRLTTTAGRFYTFTSDEPGYYIELYTGDGPQWAGLTYVTYVDGGRTLFFTAETAVNYSIVIYSPSAPSTLSWNSQVRVMGWSEWVQGPDETRAGKGVHEFENLSNLSGSPPSSVISHSTSSDFTDHGASAHWGTYQGADWLGSTRTCILVVPDTTPNWYPDVFYGLVQGLDYDVIPGKDPGDVDAFVEYETGTVDTILGWVIPNVKLSMNQTIGTVNPHTYWRVELHTGLPSVAVGGVPSFPSGPSGTVLASITADFDGSTITGIADPGPVSSVALVVYDPDLWPPPIDPGGGQMVASGDAYWLTGLPEVRVTPRRFRYWVPKPLLPDPNLTGAVGPERVRFYRPETHNIRP